MSTSCIATYNSSDSTVTLSSGSTTTANMNCSAQDIYNNISSYYNVSSSNPGLIYTKTGWGTKGNISYTLSDESLEYYLFTQLNINSITNYYNIVGLQASNATTSYVYLSGFIVNNCTLTAEDTSVEFTFNTGISSSFGILPSNYVSYIVNITTTLDYEQVDCQTQSGKLLQLTKGTTYITTYSFSYASSPTTPQITIEIFTQYNGSRLVPTQINYTIINMNTDSDMITSPIAFLCNMFYGISYDSYINEISVNPTGNNEEHSIENCIIIAQMLAPLYTNFLS
jgi:hypothetical protein